MKTFWDGLKRPFFVIAPMADVTDPAYRSLIAEKGGPDVMWTEFVSADGIYHTRETKKMKDEENPLLRDLQFVKGEHPIVAQLFTSIPENMAYAAKLCAELGFDGIDINMGCPDRSIEKQGAGAAMIKSPEKAIAVIEAAKTSGLPVSVKTRIGYNKEIIDEWIPKILSAKPAALTVHLRTRKEMSLVPAHWDLMPRVVKLRDELSPETLILGNGDVKDLDDARAKVAATGCDGVMLGRAIFGNPWLFAGRKAGETPVAESLEALVELARRFENLKPGKSFHILKKHVKAFVNGFDGAAELRAKLMDAESADEMASAIAGHPL